MPSKKKNMINCFIVDTHAKLYNYLMSFLFLLLYPKDHQWFIVQLRNKYLTVFLYLWALCVMSYSFLTKMMWIIFRLFDVYIEYTELISIHFCLGARWSLPLGAWFSPWVDAWVVFLLFSWFDVSSTHSLFPVSVLFNHCFFHAHFWLPKIIFSYSLG